MKQEPKAELAEARPELSRDACGRIESLISRQQPRDDKFKIKHNLQHFVTNKLMINQLEDGRNISN